MTNCDLGPGATVTARVFMNWRHREPTLDEILSDSITKAMMKADGIDPQELAASLRQVRLSPVRRSRQWGPWSTTEALGRR